MPIVIGSVGLPRWGDYGLLLAVGFPVQVVASLKLDVLLAVSSSARGRRGYMLAGVMTSALIAWAILGVLWILTHVSNSEWGAEHVFALAFVVPVSVWFDMVYFDSLKAGRLISCAVAQLARALGGAGVLIALSGHPQVSSSDLLAGTACATLGASAVGFFASRQGGWRIVIARAGLRRMVKRRKYLTALVVQSLTNAISQMVPVYLASGMLDKSAMGVFWALQRVAQGVVSVVGYPVRNAVLATLQARDLVAGRKAVMQISVTLASLSIAGIIVIWIASPYLLGAMALPKEGARVALFLMSAWGALVVSSSAYFALCQWLRLLRYMIAVDGLLLAGRVVGCVMGASIQGLDGLCLGFVLPTALAATAVVVMASRRAGALA